MKSIFCRSVKCKTKILVSSFSSVPAVHQNISGRKRFYKVVDVIPAEGGKAGEYCITLDGRTLKTPGRNPLILPNIELAMVIGAEWDAQTSNRNGIEPATMPLMSLASTAIDQVKIDPDTSINTCIKYLPTDSALFLTSESDRILLAQQKQHFLPVIDWINESFGVSLATTESMAGRIVHPDESIAKLEAVLANMDHFSLACLQGATLECKSVLLAMAFIARNIDLDQVRAASRLEEEFQVEIWGVVEGGHDMDRLNNTVRLSSVGTFMSLLYSPTEMQEKWNSWVK